MRSLVLACLLAPGFAAQAAEPIFVPDFTPGSGDEFTMAVMLQGMVSDKLLQDGHIVLSSEVVATVVGAQAIANCAASPTCPQQIMPQIPTRIAIVVRLNRMGETLVGHVELFEQSTPNALDVLDVPIAAGNEHLFAAEVSKSTKALLQKVGASPDEVLMAAARLIAGQPPAITVSTGPGPAPAPAPLGDPGDELPPDDIDLSTPVPAPAPVGLVDLDDPDDVPAIPMVRQKRGDGSTPHTGPIEEVLADTGVHRRHLLGTEKHFMKSGLDPRDYMYTMMPHAGRLTIEVRAGLGMGDVDRQADIRVETGPSGQTNGWYQEAPLTARNVRGGIYAGFAPATMVDLGVLVGLQYGQRFLTTGTYTLDDNGAVANTDISDQTRLQAVNFYIQPRVRAYLVPLGPAKPFLVTGMEFKVFDQYQLEQPGDRSFPVPPGALVPGWIGGGGMMIDPGPIVGLFAEGSYTRHFGSRAGRSDFNESAPWPHDFTAFSAFTGGTIAVNGGVQFRL